MSGSAAKTLNALRHSDPAIQQEGADFVHRGCALANEAGAHPMQALKIELLGRLRRDKPHRWPLYGLRNRLGVPEIVLVAFEESLHIFRRHQPGVVAKGDQLPAQMMSANTGLHADQAGRDIGEPPLKLAARKLSFEDDGSAPVEANQVENCLADVDADHSNRRVRLR